MPEPKDAFVDSTTLNGIQRIRRYTLGWLERMDYAGRLDREERAEQLGALAWARLEREYRTAWRGPVVTNRVLAEQIAASMVEDYRAAFPERRTSRYTVSGPLGDAEFRRAVLDWVHDLEEFEPDQLPATAEEAAAKFWEDVRARPDRWGYDPERGPLVDDEPRAREIAVEAIRDHWDLLRAVAEQAGK